ncbi:MAG: copper resistance protein CopC [Alphaproteobacteria bacterium]|nr:MAG: copper resistance protein CopC [Alphaproteobacteria bacterium]
MASIFLKWTQRVKRSRAGWACLPAAAATIAYFALAADLLAHARLKRANPAVGGVVSVMTLPAELQVWFSEPVEPALSSIEVRAADGTRMDRGDLRGDAADRTQLRLTLLPLPPSTYRVVWRVVSVDTHRTNGSFPFRVEP